MNLKEYLRSDTKASSMRLAFLLVAVTSGLTACFGGTALAVIDLFRNQGRNLLGVAAIIGALAGVAGVAFAGKQAQARDELQKKE